MKVPVFKACHVEEQSETSQRFFGTCVPQNDRKKTVMPPNEMRIRHLPTPFRHAAKAGIPALAKASKSGRPLSLGKNASRGGVTRWGVPHGKAG